MNRITLIESIKSVLSYVSGDEAEHYLALADVSIPVGAFVEDSVRSSLRSSVRDSVRGEVGLEGHVWVALAELYRALGHEGTTIELAQRAASGKLKAELQLK